MTESGGYIYALCARGTRYIKIGSTTKSVERRVKELQIGHPLPLDIVAIAAIECDVRGIEKRIQRLLHADHCRGEWFELLLTPEMLQDYVARALAGEEPVSIVEDTDFPQCDFGPRITYLRNKSNISQAELARRAKIGQSTLNGYETGSRPALRMSVEIAMRLARALGVSVDHLIGMYEDASDDEEDAAA